MNATGNEQAIIVVKWDHTKQRVKELGLEVSPTAGGFELTWPGGRNWFGNIVELSDAVRWIGVGIGIRDNAAQLCFPLEAGA